MPKHARGTVLVFAFLIGATTLVAAGVGAGQAGAKPSVPLTVHEWGTFTSVAGEQGQAVEWRPLSGPSDLPCFVRVLNPVCIKCDSGGVLPAIRATVRMETPVLYFYAAEETSVQVRVRFPQGLITEWFPNAVVPLPAPFANIANGTGAIDWPNVTITPNVRPNLPVEQGASHYYAARETDAVHVSVGGQPEKFLFYRGLASFPVPIMATTASDGRMTIVNAGRHEPGRLILFENRGGRIGYRMLDGLKDRATIDPPVLGASFDALRQDLERALVDQGLYAREAAAMVATWRDSWFEAGVRVFYILSQAAVDEILPLTIDPKPADVKRAFVGRLEVITPSVEADVATAIERNDMKRLLGYGRFLEPIAARILARTSSQVDAVRIREAVRLVTASQMPELTCR